LKQNPSRHFFWQTCLAIVLGVLTGCLLLSILQRRPAEALTAAGVQLFSPTSAPIQILPTLSQQMNVLVMGVDSNGPNTERFVNTRSDTMIVVSMDPAAHKVSVISIPRDSRVKISGNHGMDKINSAHAFGGPQLAMQTVTENFSVPIDHYVVVDTTALKELCQLLGPVSVLVEKEMHYKDAAGHLQIDLQPGLQVLQPEQVEQYVRFRHDAKGDIGRIERQQWFFRAAAHKRQDPQFLLRLPDLIRLAHDYVQTDLSLEDMAHIANFARDVKPQKIVTATLPGAAEMINGGSYWVPDVDGCRVVLNRILGLKNDAALVADDNGNAAKITGTTEKPLVVAIRYPKGAEPMAAALERRLTESGYNVRYKWLMPSADCQHEQIIQMSGRADDETTAKLRAQVPELTYWPVALQLDSKPLADLTVVISPDSQFAEATAAGNAFQELSVHPDW
jgi:LCP family protein required for cell wall assembly